MFSSTMLTGWKGWILSAALCSHIRGPRRAQEMIQVLMWRLSQGCPAQNHNRAQRTCPQTELLLKGSRGLHPPYTWSHGTEIPPCVHWWRSWSAGDSFLKRSHTFVALNHKMHLFLSVGIGISFNILHCCHLVPSRLRRQY